MKHPFQLFLLGTLFLLSPAHAKITEVPLTVLSEARIHFQSDAPGSFLAIEAEGEDGGADSFILKTANSEAQETLKNLIANHKFHKQQSSLDGKAIGYVVKESGHMPNPTYTFKVFYALGLDFPQPRGTVPQP